jgi:hypothetical protein
MVTAMLFYASAGVFSLRSHCGTNGSVEGNLYFEIFLDGTILTEKDLKEWHFF